MTTLLFPLVRLVWLSSVALVVGLTSPTAWASAIAGMPDCNTVSQAWGNAAFSGFYTDRSEALGVLDAAYGGKPAGMAYSTTKAGVTVACNGATCAPYDVHDVCSGGTWAVTVPQITADDYSAVGVVFSALLLAGVLVWGARRIGKLFDNAPDS